MMGRTHINRVIRESLLLNPKAWERTHHMKNRGKVFWAKGTANTVVLRLLEKSSQLPSVKYISEDR